MKKTHRRAALYSVHPHELGLCGPQGSNKGKLYQYLTTKTKVGDEELRRLLEQFWAVSSYLKLIAESNEIEDWLDLRVVDAYWIGNNLLGRVRVEDLREVVRGFAGKGVMTEKTAGEIAARIPHDAMPHHSFHVFGVGSITGKVERGSIRQELCRIGWGEVCAVKKNGRERDGRLLVVRTRTLVRQNGEYRSAFDGEELTNVRRDPALLPNIQVGDIVTIHWNMAVEIINLEQARRLEEYTRRTLATCRRMWPEVTV